MTRIQDNHDYRALLQNSFQKIENFIRSNQEYWEMNHEEKGEFNECLDLVRDEISTAQ